MDKPFCFRECIDCGFFDGRTRFCMDKDKLISELDYCDLQRGYWVPAPTQKEIAEDFKNLMENHKKR